MPKTNDLKTELEEIEQQIPKMEKVVNKNVYHVLLKLWGKLLLVTFGIGIIFGVIFFIMLAHFAIDLPSQIFNIVTPENKIETILGPSVTAIGLVLGFSPVISFFFVNNLNEEQRKFIEAKKNFLMKISDVKELATKENKSTVETYYGCLQLIINNRNSGVLKYVSSFLIISLIMLPMLIEFSIIFNPIIFLLIDLFSIFAIVEGVVPIITICTRKPTIRIKTYLASTDIPNQLVIKKKFEIED